MGREIMVQRDADGVRGIILIGSEGRESRAGDEAPEGRTVQAGNKDPEGRESRAGDEVSKERTGRERDMVPEERNHSERGGRAEGRKSFEGSKRRFYFERAAAEAGISISYYDWKDFPFPEGLPNIGNSIVKIDAPEWKSSRLKDLDELTGRYREQLRLLSRMPFGAFFNHPGDIAEVLDKRKCKKRLAENGVAVTEMYGEKFSGREELLDFMRENRIYQIFLKPLRGSGAAGVTALRFSPVKGKVVLYTCAALLQGELVNTKRLYRLEDEDAAALLDPLLELDCVVEKWHRKAAFQEYCYDLRVIVQDGQVDYILPRLSRGPITNLHLNNHSMEFERLNLDGTVTDSIMELCIRAAGCYPGLKSIGMDVLLEKESRKPYIIEMNAQGDLLHRDVYHENNIYKRQIEIMRNMYIRSDSAESFCFGKTF